MARDPSDVIPMRGFDAALIIALRSDQDQGRPVDILPGQARTLLDRRRGREGREVGGGAQGGERARRAVLVISTPGRVHAPLARNRPARINLFIFSLGVDYR